jgi:carboxypeptidase Taq
MATTATKYSDLVKRLREIDTLQSISGLLGWDEMVMLPPGSSQLRGEQKTALAGVLFDKQTDSILGGLLGDLSKAEGLTDVQSANVREANRGYKKLVSLPKELVQRIASLETEGYNAWNDARKNKDFSKFSAVLSEWVEIGRKKASLIDPCAAPYDVLLDEYEKGLNSTRVDEIFDTVRTRLVPLLKRIKEQVSLNPNPKPNPNPNPNPYLYPIM